MQKYEIFKIGTVKDPMGFDNTTLQVFDCIEANGISGEPTGFVLYRHLNEIVYVVPEGCGVRLKAD